MSEPVPAPLPLVAPQRLEEARLPKRMLAVLVLAVFFGASATIASVIAAKTSLDTGLAQQEDVEENQRILHATCENTRVITEQFASTPPSPCPSVKE